jgi:hypothetical protein
MIISCALLLTNAIVNMGLHSNFWKYENKPTYHTQNLSGIVDVNFVI